MLLQAQAGVVRVPNHPPVNLKAKMKVHQSTDPLPPEDAYGNEENRTQNKSKGKNMAARVIGQQQEQRVEMNADVDNDRPYRYSDPGSRRTLRSCSKRRETDLYPTMWELRIWNVGTATHCTFKGRRCRTLALESSPPAAGKERFPTALNGRYRNIYSIF